MSVALSDKHRIHFESEWASWAADSLLPSETALYRALSYTSKVNVHSHTPLVLYEPVQGLPVALDLLHLVDFKLDLSTGPEAFFRTTSGLEFTLTTTPFKLPDADLFLWLPSMNDIRWCPERWNDRTSPRIFRTAVAFRQRMNPAFPLEDNCRYLSKQRDFRERLKGLQEQLQTV